LKKKVFKYQKYYSLVLYLHSPGIVAAVFAPQIPVYEYLLQHRSCFWMTRPTNQ